MNLLKQVTSPLCSSSVAAKKESNPACPINLSIVKKGREIRNPVLKWQTKIVRKRVIPAPMPTIPTTAKIPVEVFENNPPTDEIFVVGGGPSLIGFDFNRLNNKTTITVNKSIFDVPRPNYFISVDFTFFRKINKSKFNAIPAKKFFVADFSFPFMQEVQGVAVDTRYNLRYDLPPRNTLIKAQKKEGFGFNFDDFRTGKNSGYCALQLAILLGYKKIYLLGLDLNKQDITHYHGGYGERPTSFNAKVDIYFDYFQAGLGFLNNQRPDIQVISCSAGSRLNNLIQYKSIEEVLS